MDFTSLAAALQPPLNVPVWEPGNIFLCILSLRCSYDITLLWSTYTQLRPAHLPAVEFATVLLSYSELLEEFEHCIQAETGNDHLSSSGVLHALAGIMGIQNKLIRGNHYRRSSLIELITVQRSMNKAWEPLNCQNKDRGRTRVSLAALACSTAVFRPRLLFVCSTTSQAYS